MFIQMQECTGVQSQFTQFRCGMWCVHKSKPEVKVNIVSSYSTANRNSISIFCQFFYTVKSTALRKLYYI